MTDLYWLIFLSENYFAAFKIHCSRQTKLLLETLGGYNTIERGPVSIKVCSDCSVNSSNINWVYVYL